MPKHPRPELVVYELRIVILRFLHEHYLLYRKTHKNHEELWRYLNSVCQERVPMMVRSLVAPEQLREIAKRTKVSVSRARANIAPVFHKILQEARSIVGKNLKRETSSHSKFAQYISAQLRESNARLVRARRYTRVFNSEGQDAVDTNDVVEIEDLSSESEDLEESSEESSEEEIELEEDDSDDDGEQGGAVCLSQMFGGGRVIRLSNILSALERSKDQERGGKMSKEAKEFSKLLRDRETRSTSDVDFFDRLSAPERKIVLSELRTLNTDVSKFRPIIFRLLLSNIDADTKAEIMARIDNSESEGPKFFNWLEGLLKIPFGVYLPSVCDEIRGNARRTRAFLNESCALLNSVVYGHAEAKHAILQFLGQLVKNPARDASASILGFEGPPGNGKTTLCNGLAKALRRPFFSIPLGGASDASFLNGHSYTYEGSTYGQIVQTLMKAKSMSPVIYLDELDKVSKGYKGDEIVNLLIHLTDTTQNSFQDKYFNVDIDLSGVTWIFSYNDASCINPVLLDRITQVRTSGFTQLDKIQIARKFLIPKICKNVCIDPATLHFSDDVIRSLIHNYTREGGVRRLKELLTDVIQEINLEELRGTIVLHPAKRRKRARGGAQRVLEITDETVQKYLPFREKYMAERIHDVPMIGRVNGMYACSNGTGGIIPIEVNYLPSDTMYALNMTGNLGDVMKESTKVARTLAWSLIAPEHQDALHTRWTKHKQCIHVNCTEQSMRKEGPSATAAMTAALVSLLTQQPIRHDIAITGEANLTGEVTEIGGLREKMYGAKQAGCAIILYPRDNQKSMDRIVRECPDLLVPGEFEARSVSNIHEVLEIALLGHKHIAPPRTIAERVDSDEKAVAMTAVEVHSLPVACRTRSHARWYDGYEAAPCAARATRAAPGIAVPPRRACVQKI